MIGLEKLADGTPADRNFNRLDSLTPDMGGQSVGMRWGAGTVTFPGGSVNTSTLTVAHGLGKAPQSIQLQPIADATPLDLMVTTVAPDATSFVVRGRTTDGSSPAAASTQTFYWLAIG